MVADFVVEQEFLPGKFGELKASFDGSNPPSYARGYFDASGDVFRQIRAVQKDHMARSIQTDQAAQETRGLRINQTMHDIVQDRMVPVLEPSPPNLASDGRGGRFDMKAIYAEARHRVDSSDQYLKTQQEQNLKAHEERLLDGAEDRAKMQQMPPARRDFNMGAADMNRDQYGGGNNHNQGSGFSTETPNSRSRELSLGELEQSMHQIITRMNQERAEASTIYAKNKAQFVQDMAAQGERNPELAARAKQRSIIEGIENKAHVAVQDGFNNYRGHDRGPHGHDSNDRGPNNPNGAGYAQEPAREVSWDYQRGPESEMPHGQFHNQSQSQGMNGPRYGANNNLAFESQSFAEEAREIQAAQARESGGDQGHSSANGHGR